MKQKLIVIAMVFLTAFSLVTISYPQPTIAAFPGANGKVVFTTFRDGNYEIYTMDLDGSNPVNLTNNPNADFEPNWSPDGTKIVFRSLRDGADDLYIMDVDGNNQQRLTTTSGQDIHGSFSPDGTQIVFASVRDGGDFELYTMDADGSNQTRITTNATREISPRFSPDGTKILYVGGLGTASEVFVMDSDGTNLQQLTSNSVTESGPDWSPDGAKIVFYRGTGGGDIYTMDADGSNVSQVTTEATSQQVDPSWSPDGQKLIFQSNTGGDFEIVVSNIDGSNQVALTDNAVIDQNPRIQPLVVPTATNDPDVTTTAGKPVVINVLDNDTDPYDSLDPSSITITSAPLNGSTSVNTTTGAITYTPNANFTGNDSFTYQVCSSYSELCDTATVNITVTPGLPKTGDGSASNTTPLALVALGAVFGLTAFSTKLHKQRECMQK